MLEDQIIYLNAARNRNSLFYTDKLNAKTDPFTLRSKPNSLWINKDTEYWHYVIYRPAELPEQGWKIHLSVTLNQAQNMLDFVTPWLIKEKISFKFVSNLYQLLYSNSKYGDRSESGKFITIYPRNNKEFEFLLVRLKELTRSFNLGPYILSDQNWQESNVYFRYGAFKPIYIVTGSGKKIPAIYTPEGKKCEDKRLPYYQKPDFVKDLAIFKKNTFPDPKIFLQLSKYQIKSALHFSNAGGVYLALKDNKKVVLKEGRQEAGLDANKNDGFTRVQSEAKILNKLSDVEGVVNYYTDFTSWRHHFLVEEYIEGQSLEEILPMEFPFILGDSEKRRKYKIKVKHILRQLKQIIREVHNHGIAIGDLSLSNILITDKDDVRLIDLENTGLVSQKYTPGLTTTGFVSNGVKTFGEADDFALMRIAYYLFLPIIPIADMAPEIIYKHKKWIQNNFGKDVIEFLNEFNVNVDIEEPIFLRKFMTIPTKDLNSQTVDYFVEGLSRGILNHLNFNKLKLVPGLIDNGHDPINLLNLSEGAAGIIWALNKKEDYDERINNWIQRHKRQIISISQESYVLGLFNGISGLANVLKYSNHLDIANKLIDIIAQKIDFTHKDNSLATGLAGLAFTLRERYPDITKKIIEMLLTRWNSIDFNNFEDEDVGLLTGWGGVSYLFWCFNKRKEAKEIITHILQNHSEGEDNLSIKDHSRGFDRLIPYLENGSFGLTLLMHKFMREDKEFKNKYQMMFDRLKKSCLTYCTYMETLVSGYAGVIPIAAAIAKDGDCSMLDYSLAALNQFLVSNDEEIMAPGKYGYKLSVNFSYGSAGLLTSLRGVNQFDEFYWLPL